MKLPPRLKIGRNEKLDYHAAVQKKVGNLALRHNYRYMYPVGTKHGDKDKARTMT
jgi:hypothetical protein